MSDSEPGPAVDPHGALDALGYEASGGLTRVAGGWDTLIWRFSTVDGSEHALRIFHRPRLRQTAWRERAALLSCAASGFPVPQVEAFQEIDAGPAMVLSWCFGEPLLSVVERRPWLTWKLGRVFGQTQARLHAITPPPELAVDAPEDWLTRPGDEYVDLTEHVRSLRPTVTALIHMDFHPLNIICRGPRVTGVIDWAGAAAGDPRADLARTAVTLIAAPIPPDPLRPLLNLARKLVVSAWRSGYRQVVGQMPDYQPFMAWAGATLLAEIELLIGEEHVWGTPEDVAKLRTMIDGWAREAGAR